MPRHKRERRVILVFVSTVVILTVLIGVAGYQRRLPTNIMPPESPEMTAKRESRENAYYTLLAAMQMRPAVPEALKAADDDFEELTDSRYPLKGSIGHMFSVARFDDDPELGAFIEQLIPSVEKMRESHERDYYLLPKIPRPERGEDYFYPEVLASRCLVLALYNNRVRHDDEAAWVYLMDAMRMLRLTAQDEHVGWRHNTDIFRSLVGAMPELARGEVSPATLLAAQRELEAFSRDPARLEERLALSFRRRDLEVTDTRHYGPVNAVLATWSMKKTRRFVRTNKQRYFDALQYPVRVLRHYDHDTKDELSELRAVGRYSWQPIWNVVAVVQSYADKLTYLRGATIVLALERFHQQEGRYPETLEALVPAYLEAVPVDGFDDQPFAYRLEDRDYWLVSPGMDGKVDAFRGGKNSQSDALIHRPPPPQGLVPTLSSAYPPREDIEDEEEDEEDEAVTTSTPRRPSETERIRILRRERRLGR